MSGLCAYVQRDSRRTDAKHGVRFEMRGKRDVVRKRNEIAVPAFEVRGLESEIGYAVGRQQSLEGLQNREGQSVGACLYDDLVADQHMVQQPARIVGPEHL